MLQSHHSFLLLRLLYPPSVNTPTALSKQKDSRESSMEKDLIMGRNTHPGKRRLPSQELFS
jgi:hypothetical protein